MQEGRWNLQSIPDAEFVRKVLIVLAIGVVALLAWQLREVLLLAFGAILVAVILHAFAEVLARYLKVPERWALTAGTLTIFVVAVGLLVLFGAQIRLQIASVAERLPFALNNFTQELGLGEVTPHLPQMLDMGAGGGFVSRLAGIGGAILGGLSENLSLVVGFPGLLLVALAFYALSAAPWPGGPTATAVTR